MSHEITFAQATAAFLRLGEAFGEIAKTLTNAVTPALIAFRRDYEAVDWDALLLAEEREPAYRLYAAHYTATHPRGLSWRRLNRPQRRAAAYDYWLTLQ